ncbi:MAG: ABC transporter ATP-binding protein/permease [Clostridiales Family XIII bacterium]|jgi:ATP-binding cassette subfamily B protein|nr:ABC transporter ATP-binding protein/permease [Clostridiales Family XIII bacterium]
MAENKRKRFGRAHISDTVPVEKAKDFKGTFIKILKEVFKHKFLAIISVVFALFGTIFNIIGPKVMSRAITEIFNQLMGKYLNGNIFNFNKIIAIVLVLLLLYIASMIFSAVQGVIMARITQDICKSLRRQVCEKIDRVPFGYFEKKMIGDTLSLITNDIEMLGTGMNQSLTQAVTSVVTILGVIIMMFSINVLMTLTIFTLLPISFFLMWFIMAKSQKHFKAQQTQLAKTNSQIEEMVSGQDIIKLYNHDKKTESEFNRTNKKLFSSAWKSQFFSGIMMPISQFVGNLGYVGVALFGGVLAFKGIITIGDIQGFILYVRNFTMPITQLAQITNMLQSMAAAAERVYDFLEIDEIIPDSDAKNQDFDPHAVKGDVIFSNIKFGYIKNKPVISNFSLDVKAGQTVAIVGATGAGKSTLVKLLMRFYDVWEGEIEVDGNRISDIRKDSLRECFGMVLQETWLYNGSIMENIRYGNENASDEEVITAAKMTYADHFIRTLPNGYNFVLNEEADNISDGQKQLLTIVRAALADRPILILDEATSSVDTVTEDRIQKAMNKLMEKRTSFVIAHRLSTIRDADIILVLKDGDIVETGTHNELLKNNGQYADLYDSQFAH